MNNLFINFLRISTLGIFIAIIPLLLYVENTTKLVWTILIPLLPIGILIIGFSRWRDVCPLALVSKISQRINPFEKRKVPEWLENNFWYFQYFLLFISLSLRLVTLNNNNFFLALFFILIIVSAFVINLIFTGKSWCNFFCPVGAVEKIYALSNAKNYMLNSACTSCTACKKNCPDIDLESNYWKEGASAQKSFVFYSFAGMILGFYLYFYFQSGSFSYYFSGEWTNSSLNMFSEGFFFAPFIPVFIAAPLTLVVFTYLSFIIFKNIEHYVWQKRICKSENYETTVHRIKSISSFVAFNIFYIFAGVPSYQHYPILYGIFYFLIVSFSTLILYKEFFREEVYFIQERFALKILKRWNKTVMPTNLKEIYFTYMNENKNKKDKLKMYRLSITELMQEGILNERSLQTIEKLREQLGISKQEHARIIKKIKLKNSTLFDISVEKSAETRYQERHYKELLKHLIDEHRELDSAHVKSMQKQFCISDVMHNRIVQTLLQNDTKLQNEIMDLLTKLEELLVILHKIYDDETREISFLKYCIHSEFNFISKELFSILFTLYKDNHKTLKTLLDIAKRKQVDNSFIVNAKTLNFLNTTISTKMLEVYQSFIAPQIKLYGVNNNDEIIQTLLKNDSSQIMIAALLNTKSDAQKYLKQDVLEKFDAINCIDTNSLLYKLKYNTDTITSYEKMMYINSFAIFKDLKFDDLHLLSKSAAVEYFQTDDLIIKQGSVAKTFYVLIRGGAIVNIDGIDIKTLGHREYFGEVAVLGDIKRLASIRAIMPTVALSITKSTFKTLLQNNPKVSAKVMKAMIHKLL